MALTTSQQGAGGAMADIGLQSSSVLAPQAVASHEAATPSTGKKHGRIEGLSGESHGSQSGSDDDDAPMQRTLRNVTAPEQKHGKGKGPDDRPGPVGKSKNLAKSMKSGEKAAETLLRCGSVGPPRRKTTATPS